MDGAENFSVVTAGRQRDAPLVAGAFKHTTR